MIDPKLKVNFFDRTKGVLNRVAKAKKRILSRAGAKQRGVMRRLLRYRKKKTAPEGQAPFVHTTGSEFGLKTIFFVYEPKSESVIVGPVGRGNTPRLINEGGFVTRRSKNGKIYRQRIGKRPFRDLAFEKYRTQYPKEYEDILNG